jgi:hypothetical protein
MKLTHDVFCVEEAATWTELTFDRCDIDASTVANTGRLTTTTAGTYLIVGQVGDKAKRKRVEP